MSDTSPVPASPVPPAPAGPSGVTQRSREAIARAAERTGTDFSYLLAQARLESSLNPHARARTSSAAGLYQFIGSTWLETVDQHGPAYGLGGPAAAIETPGARTRISDPMLRSQILAMRFDPDASALMAGALAQDNRAALTPVLGRDPDAAELYLAHFLGIGGATRFLGELATNPGASAAGLLPAAAGANRAIFYGPGGAPRSLAGVMDLIRGKMEAAMHAEGDLPRGTGGFAMAHAQWTAGLSSGSPAPATGANGHPTPAAIPSMADTLRSSFALSGSRPGAGADHVQVAYGKLKAFGL